VEGKTIEIYETVNFLGITTVIGSTNNISGWLIVRGDEFKASLRIAENRIAITLTRLIVKKVKKKT
jgi:hypothetical protein